MSVRPITPRTVKPRKTKPNNLPIIAVDSSFNALSESTGELMPIEQLVKTHPSATIVCSNPLGVLLRCHNTFSQNPDWNFRVSPVEREIFQSDAKFVRREIHIVNYMGFKRDKSTRYFYPTSPMQFCRTSLDSIDSSDKPELHKLLQWGKSVRAFCNENDLKFSLTAGSMAAQLLKDKRFYPDDRRKIPTATNEKCRQALPGNQYTLNADTGTRYRSVVYIDQSSAHHYAASKVEFPHSDNLRARGRFRDLESCLPWHRYGTKGYNNIIKNHYGLLYCKVYIPATTVQKRFIPNNLWFEGEQSIFIYTNEISYYESLGVNILWISAAWTSTKKDTGINAYARWAKETAKSKAQDKAWLKATLLAAYGILASKPKKLRNGFWKSEKGTPEHFYLGPERLTLKATETKRELQMPIANVVQRGMIEAETRKISLSFADDLTKQNYTVLSVYADAVMILDPDLDENAPNQLPLLPKPWRISDTIKFVRFLDPQSFQSPTVSKLPGRKKCAKMPSISVNGHTKGMANAKRQADSVLRYPAGSEGLRRQESSRAKGTVP